MFLKQRKTEDLELQSSQPNFVPWKMLKYITLQKQVTVNKCELEV